MKRNIVESIKNIDRDISDTRRRFESKLDYTDELDIENRLMEYIYENTNEFLDMFSKYKALRNITTLDQVRFRLYYKNYDSNSNFSSTYSVDLDEFYGITLHQYDLIIGGDNNGNLIINGGHDNNKLQYNIIHSLTTSPITQDYSCIEKLRLFTQNIYDKYNSICARNHDKRRSFNRYIRHHRVHLITNVYDKLLEIYFYILNFSPGGREFYDMLIKHGKILLKDIHKEIKDNCNEDKLYKESCLFLKYKVDELHKKINTWYWNVPSYINEIVHNNIKVPEVGDIILSFV